MKEFVLLATIVHAVAVTAAGQGIILNPGETFRYDFQSLPPVGHHDGEPWTLVQWSYDRGSLNAGDLAYWGFSTYGGPFWEAKVALTDAPPEWNPGVGLNLAALEKRGWVEITFLAESAGTLRVPGIEVILDVRSSIGGYDTFAAFIVPEPSTSLLFIAGAMAVYLHIFWHSKGARRGSPKMTGPNASGRPG